MEKDKLFNSKKQKHATRIRSFEKKSSFSILHTLLFCFIFFVAATVIINSGRYMTSVLDGLKLYVLCVLPSLVPFFVLTAILSKIPTLPLLDTLTRPFTVRLLGLASETFSLILISLMSGNPVGAKLIGEYGKKQNTSKKQLLTMCALCSMTSPIFIVSTVGGKFFGDKKVGYYLLVIQVITSLINGLIFKSQSESPMDILARNTDSCSQKHLSAGKSPLIILSDSVASCISSTLIVGAYITIFYLFTDILTDIGVVQFLAAPLKLLLSFTGYGSELSVPIVLSFVELTRGVGSLAAISSIPLSVSLPISSLMLSFSGLSIILQSFTFLVDTNIPFKKYILTKITHCFISLGLTLATFSFFFAGS